MTNIPLVLSLLLQYKLVKKKNKHVAGSEDAYLTCSCLPSRKKRQQSFMALDVT